MKNQLENLFVIFLKIWILFLLGLLAIESVLIILDSLGYDSQVKKIVSYFHL